MNYYYVDADNQVAGPLTVEQITALRAAGTLNVNSLVCPEGGQEWVSFGVVFQTSPPVPPMPPPPSFQPPSL
ncbi:MAG: DUF4339 domain-containing protein [Verrucomicrobiales bacterium]|jgi:hypothetical protein|nr:DUF4339 domain-containing protein [Verrucomicrobiales bacterium]